MGPSGGRRSIMSGMFFEKDGEGCPHRPVQVGPVTFGGDQIVIIAGPCTVESREQLMEIAWAVKEAGGAVLRGGAFKPRTSPASFQGMKEEGLSLLAEARAATGLPVVTEVLDTSQLDDVAAVADMIQIGSRNMCNSVLLRRAGASGKPVFLKRGMGATVQEFLYAAEYVLREGCSDLVLCERGIRTFEDSTRFTLDLNAVPVIKQRSWLPVLVDPSHGTGVASLVAPMARAAIACGADGIMVEIHPHPEAALCDGNQCETPEHFFELVRSLRAVAESVGRTL
ncbi:MAG: 3-deoxy-7-phosphoheptulonate synthase [Kiritimatiellae bacterium]|nr:3-deoxy-7-phosphoheptulonate synthase [Kiritimatiellia bacterium]